MGARRRPIDSVALLLVAIVVVLAGCGGGEALSSTAGGEASSPTARGGASPSTAPGEASSPSTPTAPTPDGAGRRERRVAYLERVRDAVIRGAAVDFALGTGIGGASFEACVEDRLRGALDRPTIGKLVAIYRRRYGTAHAARALNALAAPLAASCGHRSWVPELVEAAHGLRSAAPIGAAIEKLGVTYGPYLGMRCRHVGYGRCRRVGIDVVFGRAATRVVATVGHQTIHLRTPGRHNGVERRDWVGTFAHADLPRNRQRQALAYVPVELRVEFVAGRRAQARFPHVLVSSGWG